jgi:hypothetical protein
MMARLLLTVIDALEKSIKSILVVSLRLGGEPLSQLRAHLRKSQITIAMGSLVPEECG